MSEIRVDNITDEEGTGSPNIIYDNAASGLTATSIKGAIDEVSEQAVNSQELLAGVSEAADIDEAVSFIGRGAIVESSSNSNGHYVRWENGEQVCWANLVSDDSSQEGSIYRGTGSGLPVWDFPADFVNTNYVVTGGASDGVSGDVALWVGGAYDQATDSARIKTYGANEWTTAKNIEVMAWGRWK